MPTDATRQTQQGDVMKRPEPPFARTTCACKACVDCCKKQPGHLIPGDMERIAAFLGKTLNDIKGMFWSSPGAVVMDQDTGRQFRIRTITPRYDRRKKRCVFLTDDDRCSIHPVAPFGCSYADTHIDENEWRRVRGPWGLKLIQSDEYQALRRTLPEADHYKPVS
jgi:Fe-S-cluster containining protein